MDEEIQAIQRNDTWDLATLPRGHKAIGVKSVSKSWKSLIDSSEFIANYHFNNDQLQQHRVLVRYADPKVEKYVSIVDDDSFPRHKFPLIVPSNIRRLLGYDPSILGSSQGVICFCVDFGDSTYWYYSGNEAKTFVLWNPTIQKSVPVVVPGLDDRNYRDFKNVYGFGVCPRTSVAKLVKVSYISDLIDIDTHTPQVEISSLSLGSWRRSSSMNVPRKCIQLRQNHVCVDKCIYRYAFDRTVIGKTYHSKNLILSFDMTTEEFTEVQLCDGLKEEYSGDAYGCCGYLRLSKLGTSLVVLEPKDGLYKEISVWRMEHGVPNSFTKLFIIKSLIESLQINEVHGFRKTGEPIIDTGMTTTDKNYIGDIVVYEPKSGEISDIGITSAGCLYLAQSYIETLVLHDH
ncbi:F-box/kelch-repeat protein At3g06240-like [Rutidosis leptorrhynchoides]|uniref:F-box/kelch-repeat protein At3g06240-like n=1 Tax=Rutidosis leptorrhynchoides TaxID=125765 RepID=UPI003A9A3C5B